MRCVLLRSIRLIPFILFSSSVIPAAMISTLSVSPYGKTNTLSLSDFGGICFVACDGCAGGDVAGGLTAYVFFSFPVTVVAPELLAAELIMLMVVLAVLFDTLCEYNKPTTMLIIATIIPANHFQSI
ncbi:MAG: hypothetical protein HW406_317 [Candidatus Brocadiaceae bacterium]|nr:hypothetical protein [Candidatus Brocadiaceae bacterium]